VDALWKRERLVVELDSRRFYGDAFALEADSEKTRYLRSLGYKVLRFTWLDVTERPEWVAACIREALSAD
jgi:very-short-patch-repair endonuclease